MNFAPEDIGEHGPSSLLAEHRLVVDWVKQHTRSGHADHLNRRISDQDRHCALYYIEGLGRGDGERFALVHRQDLVLFDVYTGGGVDGPHLPVPCVHEISVFEGVQLPRAQIRRLISAATGAYGHADISFEKTRWRVIPKKFSRLYWTERARTWWQRHRPRLKAFARNGWGMLTSPLMAALCTGALLARASGVPGWAPVLAGVWLALRLHQYDDDYRAGLWWVGVKRLKHGMQAVLRMQRRLMEPRPLRALEVKVARSHRQPTFCTVSVTNKSFLPVPYVSIGAIELAQLVAPGFTESLRARNKGAIDGKELNQAYVALVKKWLMPGQSASWPVALLNDYPMTRLKREVAAVVSISHYVSGEKKPGPTSFLLLVVS